MGYFYYTQYRVVKKKHFEQALRYASLSLPYISFADQESQLYQLATTAIWGHLHNSRQQLSDSCTRIEKCPIVHMYSRAFQSLPQHVHRIYVYCTSLVCLRVAVWLLTRLCTRFEITRFRANLSATYEKKADLNSECSELQSTTHSCTAHCGLVAGSNRAHNWMSGGRLGDIREYLRPG